VIPSTLITAAPLDHAALVNALDASGIGAVAIFLGLVRDHNKGRKVLHLEYEAYEPLALRGLDLIVAEAREKWPAVTLAIHHRIGRMAISETASRSRRHAASRRCVRGEPHAIERIRQIVPIWKHEYFEGGDVWIEGATADPDNAAAREEALRIACA
jgi:molybdopterin synthase catalytic subunit